MTISLRIRRFFYRELSILINSISLHTSQVVSLQQQEMLAASTSLTKHSNNNFLCYKLNKIQINTCKLTNNKWIKISISLKNTTKEFKVRTR